MDRVKQKQTKKPKKTKLWFASVHSTEDLQVIEKKENKTSSNTAVKMLLAFIFKKKKKKDCKKQTCELHLKLIPKEFQACRVIWIAILPTGFLNNVGTWLFEILQCHHLTLFKMSRAILRPSGHSSANNTSFKVKILLKDAK